MNRLLVFGCGEIAKKTHRYINKSKNRVHYYIDNNAQKVGGKYLGREVISPESVAAVEYDYILLTSIYWRDMRRQLLELGVEAKRIKCPLAPMKLGKFKKDYREIYNMFGKLSFYYDRWYQAEQFHPDFMGTFVNPYFWARKMLYETVKKYAHYMSGICLDFGCGTSPYRKLLAVDEYVGVEIESEDKRQGITYYDGYTLPFKEEKFDSIFSSQVFEHIFNIEDIVMELNRVLKPGGVMLLTVPFAYPKHCEPYDYKRYTQAGIENLLKNAGFEMVVSERTSGYWECIAQFKNVYWEEEVRVRTGFGKVLKNVILVYNNLEGVVKRLVLPYSDKLYLDNVIVVKKQ